ncbi:LuxR family transcriptional regulator [Pseudohoeflea suaedae]|uniref:LuxR family transcriptional regulator n=1 Tax=Pseudohoeflea suaedae TaxID=877384 RepID=A0A4R5PJS4_9HYPH|nr:helix-turn-helix transcriptional regulator [Pseudohoeflea suaedae]TDH35933.1 LuxR family transcriptional regulator [Pseudohoeflea suaedae]
MNHADRPSRIPLTRTELKCLGHVAQGWSDEEIGRSLILSMQEVESVLTNAVNKLGTPNRSAAVAKAARLGLFSDSLSGNPYPEGTDYKKFS